MSKSRPRLYVEHTLLPDIIVPLDPGQVHYLRDVLRLKETETVSLFNERNGEWSAEIVFFKKDKGECRITKQIHAAPGPSAVQITMAAALIKRDAMDWAVEKASELGVHIIQPLITARTQSHHTNTQRLATIATEAAEQCDRLDRPSVLEPVSLLRFLDNWPKDSLLFFAAETGDASAIAEAVKTETIKSGIVGFLIGPEGGFTEDEHILLRRYGFVRPIRLGPRLMRAETAAIAVLAAWQAIAGDWQ